MKLKPAPGMKSQADAIYFGAYGVDIAAERTANKRQIQIARHKAKLAEAKAKETEAKAKETEAKAKETEAKAKENEAKAKELTIALILNLRANCTVEQLANIAKTSVLEVQTILDEHPVENN